MKAFYLILFSMFFIVSCGNEKDDAVLRIGDRAPTFMATDLKGNSFNLKDFAGSPVIIRFWETDCKYCKADTPVFNILHQKYKAQGLRIAYVNTLSNLAEVKRFIKDLQVEFPVLMDEGSQLAKQYHVRIVPQTIVINSKHVIVAAITGGVSEDIILDLLQGELQQ